MQTHEYGARRARMGCAVVVVKGRFRLVDVEGLPRGQEGVIGHEGNDGIWPALMLCGWHAESDSGLYALDADARISGKLYPRDVAGVAVGCWYLTTCVRLWCTVVPHSNRCAGVPMPSIVFVRRD